MSWRSIGSAKGGSDIPVIPASHYFPVTHLDHAHYRHSYSLAGWRQVAERAGVLELQGEADGNAVFYSKDILDREMRLAKRTQQLFRGGAESHTTADRSIRAGEILGNGIGRQKFINCLKTALVP